MSIDFSRIRRSTYPALVFLLLVMLGHHGYSSASILRLNRYSLEILNTWGSDQTPPCEQMEFSFPESNERIRFWTDFMQVACGKIDQGSRLSSSDIAEVNYWVILHAIRNEEPQQSLQLLHKALALDPDSSTAAYYLAETYRTSGENAHAIEWYRYALEMEGFDERFTEDKNGKTNAANSERAYYRLVDTLMHTRRWSEAEAVARKFTAEHPESAKAYSQFGELHLKLVLYKATNEVTEALVEAKRALQRSATLDPNAPRTYYYLGWVEEEQGSVNNAIEYYRQAVALNPTAQAFLWRLGSRLTWLGKYDEALPYLERSVEHIPTNPSYDAMQWVGLGDAYAAVGRSEEAKQAYLEALSIQPDNEEAKEGLSNLKSTHKLK